MALIKTMLAAAALGLAYAGPVLSAMTGWEGSPVPPGAVGADSLSKQYKNEKERIRADAKAAREKCKGMPGNARNACIAEAKANEKAVKAAPEQARNQA